MGALLLVAAGLRLFAPPAPIVIAAPVPRFFAVTHVERRLPSRLVSGYHERPRVAVATSRARFPIVNPRGRAASVTLRNAPIHRAARIFAKLPPTRVVAMQTRARVASPQPLSRSGFAGAPPHVVPIARARPRSAAGPVSRRHDRKAHRTSFAALPEAPIGYDPEPALAGADSEEPVGAQVPQTLPTIDPHRRRRR